MIKLEDVKESLTALYNEVANTSNEDFVEKRQKDYPIPLDIDMAYPLKTGTLLGGIKAILEDLDN